MVRNVGHGEVFLSMCKVLGPTPAPKGKSKEKREGRKGRELVDTPQGCMQAKCFSAELARDCSLQSVTTDGPHLALSYLNCSYSGQICVASGKYSQVWYITSGGRGRGCRGRGGGRGREISVSSSPAW